MKFQLTDRIIHMINKPDRDRLKLKTQDELAAVAEIKSEKELHGQVANLLRLRGIQFFDSRMDKKTNRPRAEPDFLFCLSFKPEADNTTGSLLTWAIGCAWELKIGNKPLSREQELMFQKMSVAPNGWRCCVVRSVDDALRELKQLGY